LQPNISSCFGIDEAWAAAASPCTDTNIIHSLVMDGLPLHLALTQTSYKECRFSCLQRAVVTVQHIWIPHVPVEVMSLATPPSLSKLRAAQHSHSCVSGCTGHSRDKQCSVHRTLTKTDRIHVQISLNWKMISIAIQM
jgi:hypothetical protein